jgi:predicted DNA-binding transcriptional regulator YafY
MLELQTKIKRQIEILGIAAENPRCWKPVDLAELYGCEELTIKRDLQELRAYGFDLHSEKKRGVRLASSLVPKQIRELIVQYIGLSNSDYAVDRATSLMTNKLKEKALSNVVMLQRCIDTKHIARIEYRKDAEEPAGLREIHPLLIFQSDGYWRVLAVNEGKIKQFHLNKILSVEGTERRFRRAGEDQLDDLFRYSFKSWIGEERHRVKIRLSRAWADRIRPQVMLDTQSLSEHPDGSTVFEATVNSLLEVASWVVTKGEGVEVLEPQRLREMVLALARGVLKNYQPLPRRVKTPEKGAGSAPPS